MRTKRLFDLAIVVAAAPFWLPLLAGVAVLVRCKLGQPVFFKQQRPGQGGILFTMWKFRSMTDERDSRGSLLPDARRLTPFGHWLRASSLDEFPELLNVLKGDMSLVGPRPLLPQYLDRYNSRQARRHEVAPGITGWAQVNGRNAVSWEERLEMDVWYVENRSLWLDLKILAATATKVFARDGISSPGEATMPEFTKSAPAKSPASQKTV